MLTGRNAIRRHVLFLTPRFVGPKEWRLAARLSAHVALVETYEYELGQSTAMRIQGWVVATGYQRVWPPCT